MLRKPSAGKSLFVVQFLVEPKVESRAFNEHELERVRDDVVEAMNQITEYSFPQYIADDHCQWCQHNQLPCAPEDVQLD
jgi:DNA helicase-2/ATP-dependent DNA helicase PcrA